MPLVDHLLRRGYAAIRVARVLDVKRLWRVSADSLRRMEIAPGYEIRQPDRSACVAAIDAGIYPAEIGSPERLDDPHNLLLTAHRDGELAAYVWFASGMVAGSQNYSRAAHLGTPLKLPPGTAFVYSAWTAPAHRGRSLMPALVSHAVAQGCCGTTALVTTTDWTNAAASRAFARVGFTPLGLIYRAGWPGCNFTWAPDTATVHGIEFGVELDGKTSFSEGSSTKV